MSWTELEMKVIRWAEDRRIIPNATPVSQLLKAVSEMGELADAEGKRDRAAIPVLWEWPAVIAATVAISLTIMDAILP